MQNQVRAFAKIIAVVSADLSMDESSDATCSDREQTSSVLANDSSNRCGVWGYAPAIRRDDSFSTKVAPRRPSGVETRNRSCPTHLSTRFLPFGGETPLMEGVSIRLML